MKKNLPLLGVMLVCLAGCATRPALQPSQFYLDAGASPVGGPMRLATENPVRRNPPRLPIVKDATLPSDHGDDGSVLPFPQPLSSSARPAGTSPVPPEADGYFTDAKPEPTALGGLFDSIFVPPTSTPPPAPTTTSTATYQTVK